VNSEAAISFRMTRTALTATGIIGAAAAALCCFTPILVILLGTVGLSAVTGHLDYVLLPAIVIFIAMVVYGFTRWAPA
jgi:mercuric ion transport protein